MLHQLNTSVKKYLPYISLSLLSLLFITSCSGPKAAQQDSDKLPNALLWKIEGKGLKEPSYLFGTIHMINKDDYFLPEGLEEAFDNSDKVVFEIDLDDMSDMGSLMGMLTGLMMKDGMTLKKLLTPEEYKEVSTYFEGMGLPMVMLGIHQGLTPLHAQLIADHGFTQLLPILAMAGGGQDGMNSVWIELLHKRLGTLMHELIPHSHT